MIAIRAHLKPFFNGLASDIDVRSIEAYKALRMAKAGADPFAIMKAMGHTDIKTTMIYVSLGKFHIRDQVEKLNAIQIPSHPAGKTTDQDQTPRLRVVSGA